MKVAWTTALLAVICFILGYRLLALESEVKQLQTSAAIAVLSAEAANDKIGAISPYFKQDKEAFIRAWLDSTNMPPAAFPAEVLTPLKSQFERMRSDATAQALKEKLFK